MRTTISLLALAALLFTAPTRATEPATAETWYVVELAGAKSGWMLERSTVADGTIFTESEMTIAMKRAGTEIKISMKTGFVETESGEPVSMFQKLEFGGAPAVSSYEWRGGEVVVTEGVGAQSFERTVPNPPGDWLTPAAAERYVVERLADAPETIEFMVLEPGAGLNPVTTTMSNFQEATIDIFGSSVPGITCDAVASNAPQIVSHNAIDLEGNLLRTSLKIGALEFSISRATRELALSPLDAPEVMSSTFVEPDRTIRNPRDLKRATFLLSVEDGAMPDLPSAGAQSVERVDDRSVRVRVDPSRHLPPDSDATDRFLARSRMIDTADPMVRSLADGADQASTRERAEYLRGVVFGHIDQKNLGVGFASASDVARSRTGDCSEHATLLAALLRVENIPSRVVSGLIYADSFAGSRDIFGYHMWTQALIEIDGTPTWVDLDATLPTWMGFDATHIAIATTPLDDNVTSDNAMLELAPLLGRLRISVESTE